MKKAVSVLLALALCLAIALAEDAGILGRPLADFTATDIDGNPFTLSEALKDHDAALIHLFSTRSEICALEGPFLEEAFARYGDRVAFIALSCDPEDTEQTVRACREAHGFSFPVGLDEGLELARTVGADVLATTLIVDRFGNVAFRYGGIFKSVRELCSVIEPFLGGDYAQTAVLDGIPAVSATGVFPVAASREVRVDNENIKPVFFTNDAPPTRLEAWIVEDSVAHVRMELPASDNPYDMVCYDANGASLHELPTLLNAQRDAYVLDAPISGGGDGCFYTRVCLSDWTGKDPEGDINVYLIDDEASLDALCEHLGKEGWVLSEAGGGERAVQPAMEAYVVHVVDQYGDPVPGAFVTFCTDSACAPVLADENGDITFAGAPQVYHVQLQRVPEGYSFDPDFEFSTGDAPDEWLLRVCRDGK